MILQQEKTLILKVMIVRKEEEIKYLKGQLERVEKELSQAREESKQQSILEIKLKPQVTGFGFRIKGGSEFGYQVQWPPQLYWL